MKFKLLSGIHVDNDKTKGATKSNPEGERVVYTAGDVIESDIDLAATLNPKDPSMRRKFERVHDLTPAGPGVGRRESATATIPPIDMSLLAAMSVKELQSFAAEEEIDLKGCAKKEDILKIIQAATK